MGLYIDWASLIAQSVKNLPAMQKTWVQFLGQKNPLEKEMAIHSSALAWKIPWAEEPGGLQSMGSQKVRHNSTAQHSTAQYKVLLNRVPAYISHSLGACSSLS